MTTRRLDQIPAAAALDGADETVVWQSGRTRRAPVQDIVDRAAAAVPVVTRATLGLTNVSDTSDATKAAPGNPIGDKIVAVTRGIRGTAASYQVQPNKTIKGPDGRRFLIRGVTFLDGLFVSFGARADYRFRTDTGGVATSGGSAQTGYEPSAWISADSVQSRMAAWQKDGFNLLRVAVEPAVVYTSAANGYPAHLDMLDTIIDGAQALGMVVQLQNGNDAVPTALNVAFMGQLRDRYWNRKNVWINPANEINCSTGGSDCTSPTVWAAEQRQYVQALRQDVLGQPTGTRFSGVIVLNAPFYGESVNLVANTLTTDPVFSQDPNLVIGPHLYMGAEASFEARIPGLVAAWGQYTGTFCMFIDEMGIHSGSVQATGTWLNKAFAYLLSLEATAFNGVTIFCGCWYIPGLAKYDDNTLKFTDGTYTSFGLLVRDALVSAPLPTKLSWTPYAPILLAETPGGTPPTFTVNAAAYQINGKTMDWRVDVSVTAAGTGSGRIVVPMPVPLVAGVVQTPGVGYNVANGKPVNGVSSGSAFLLGHIDGSAIIATGARIAISGVSEIA